MTSLYNNKNHAGYSTEEAYFYEENQKLIRKIREENQKNNANDPNSNVIDARDRFAQKKTTAQEQKDKKAA